MIHMLTGKVMERTTDSVVLQCGGVGFFVNIPTSVYASLPDIGGEGTLYTYLNVKEDGMELYGFRDTAQQSTFRTLLSVSGVGPKAALSVLSVYDPDRVALAAAAGDYKAFTACAGIGTKLAQRIVLELKDKLKAGTVLTPGTAGTVLPVSSGAAGDAVAALAALGFSQSEAAAAVASLPEGLSTEDMVAAALRALASR